jgi:hypothetical protein
MQNFVLRNSIVRCSYLVFYSPLGGWWAGEKQGGIKQ